MRILALKCIVLILILPLTVFANKKANDPIVVSINNQNITKSEFLRIYNKNNSQNTRDSKSINDYMGLFVNYKLKVIEAEHLKLDSVPAFLNEFKKYCTQLAQPYLTDSATEQKILHEAYNNMLKEVHAKHIFIKLQTYADPKDTLIAYNKAMEVRALLLKGVPFDSVAFKYSDDRNVKTNKGDLGYITAFQIIYPVEKAIFNLSKNEISQPTRSNFGYHIVQMIESRPTRGEIKVAHIMTMFPQISKKQTIDSAHIKIQEYYNKLIAGQKFEDIARQYSDDKRTGEKGGELNWFTSGQMVPEFEEASFAITKDGDYSAPIKTSYGWHIIKRLGLRPIAPFESIKDDIKQKFVKDDRSKMPEQAFINKIKKETKTKEYTEKLKLLYPLLDSSLFRGRWKSSKAASLSKEPLLVIGKTSYSIKDFADYLANSTQFKTPVYFEYVVNAVYKEFANTKVIEYEKGRLEIKHPEYKFLVQEYHDGILLFNLMEQKIWNKAASDTLGLEKYYNEHKNLYNWGNRLEALKISSTNKTTLNKAFSLCNADTKINSVELTNKTCNKDSIKECIKVTDLLIEKGDSPIIDSIGWNVGTTQIFENNGEYSFYLKKGIRNPEQKLLKEAKGAVISDYQTYLENEYISELKKKYKVNINQKELESLIVETKK